MAAAMRRGVRRLGLPCSLVSGRIFTSAVSSCRSLLRYLPGPRDPVSSSVLFGLIWLAGTSSLLKDTSSVW